MSYDLICRYWIHSSLTDRLLSAVLGNASPEHRGDRERGAVLKSTRAEHGEAREGASVLGNASLEHRGGRERGAVLKSTRAEHGDGQKGASVLGIALPEHGERKKRASGISGGP